MPSVHLKITNLPEIRAAFAQAPVKMAKNLDIAIKKTALAIQKQSMINAPVDTGRLRASHQTLFEPLKATIEPTADYAIYVHEGTRYMVGRPFLLEAVQSEEDNANGYFKKAVQDILDDIARETKI